MAEFNGRAFSSIMVTDANPVSQDQKKRTLEALERRFAVAKADLQQQQKGGKQSHEEEEEREGEGLAYTQMRELSSSQRTKKGHLTISGHTSSGGILGVPDEGASDLAYSQLCHPIHNNLVSPGNQISSRRGSTVDKIVHDLLQKGDLAQKYTQGSRSVKLDNWILLDNVVQGRGASVAARIKALKSHSKRSKRHMSMKQHKKYGSLDVPPELHNFNIFKPMHEMWKEYISELLKDTVRSQFAQCFLSADLHGAIFLVAECKITAFIEVTGIMVRETGETFGIITQENKFRVVPKKGSVFILKADCLKITLHGEKFISRNIGL